MRGTLTFAQHDGMWLPSGNTGGGSRVIAEWLIADMASGVKAVDWFLQELERIGRGISVPVSDRSDTYVNPNACYVGTGNTFSSYANDRLFYLENLFAEESRVLLSAGQIRDVLRSYRDRIEQVLKDKSESPDSFEVEWVAEGQEAQQLAAAAGLLGR